MYIIVLAIFDAIFILNSDFTTISCQFGCVEIRTECTRFEPLYEPRTC